jgi:hypothetical protein
MATTTPARHRGSTAPPTVRRLRAPEPAAVRRAAPTDADSMSPICSPVDSGGRRGGSGRRRRRLPRVTRGRTLAVLAASVVVLCGGTLTAAATLTTPAATAPRVAAPPLPGPPVDTCPPGSALPACALPTVTTAPTTTLPLPSQLPTATATTPCVGVQCLPPSSTEPTTPAQGGDNPDAQCSLFDPSTWGVCVNGMLTGFFRMVVSAALNPLLDLLGHTLLTTPTPDSIPGLADLWSQSWQILLAVYVLIVLIAGVIVMAFESLQARYTIREIAPRLVVGVVAGALSMVLATTGTELANALSTAVMGDGVDVNSAAQALTDIYLASLASQGFFELLLDLIFAGAVVAVLLTFIVRVTFTIVLIAGAPLFLMAHGLPHTEGIAYTWWKAFGGCLAIQVGQSLALIVGVRLLLTPAFTPLGPNANALTNILVGLAVMFVLFKIPFWILGAIRGGGGRRGLVSTLIRGFVAYKTFGLLRSGAGNPRVRLHGKPSPPDPYANVRTTSTGQYILPLPGLKRGRLPKPPYARHPAHSSANATGPRKAPRGVQLALPLGDDWPENKPVLGRDGQYRLPLNVKRVTQPPPPASTGQPRPSGSRHRGQQLQFEFDPYKGNRPSSAGQYPLPLGVTRTPRPASSPPPATPPRPRPRGTQLELPFDPYKGNRPLRSGQYPLPLEGLHRVPSSPRPAPTTASPASPTPRPAARQQVRLPLDLPKRPHRSTPPKPEGTR